MTDFVISTDLIVLGMSNFTGGQTFDGQTIIDVDDTEALLVRKDGDDGDVFIVDTVNDVVRIGSGIAPPQDILELTIAALGSGPDTRDSHSLLIVGQAHDGESPINVDWKQFVNVTGSNGVSTWTLQSRIGVLAFDTVFQLDDAGNLTIPGNLAVSGAGPHAIAGTPSGIIGLIISDTFTSDGSSTLASGVFITQTLIGASGDTTSLTGTTFISAITTQTEAESIANISQVEINEPFITDNLGPGFVEITNAQTLLIVNAPTEGVFNFALRVASGLSQFGGTVRTANTSGWQLQNESSTATNPTLIPERGAQTSGIGGIGGEVNIIGQGTSLLRARGGGSPQLWFEANALLGSVGADGLDEFPPEAFTVLRGNIETYDSNILAATSLQDGDFSSFANWTDTQDFSEGEGEYVYDFDDGIGTLTQSFANLAIGGKNNRWYKFTYTISNFSGAATTATITDDFAASAVTLDFSANGTFEVVFQSSSEADTADFVISVVSASPDHFNLDDLILEEIIGGDVIVAGALTGGGADGLRIDGDGVVAQVQVKSTVVIGDDETAGFGLTIGDNHQGHSPLWIVGSFTSDGAQGFSAASAWNMNLTGFAGDTVLAGLHVNNTITTQGPGEADTITNISQLFVAEPNITVGGEDIVTNAQTLLIGGAPTEGANNYAMRVVSGLSQFGGTVQLTDTQAPALVNEVGSSTNPTVIPNRTFLGTGISVVDNEGASTFHIVVDDVSLMNVGNDQFNINSILTEMNGALFVDGNTDIIQMRIDAHSTQNALLFRIRDSSSAVIFSVANSGDTLIGGDLTVSGAGPHAIAGTPSGIIGLIISETFTSDGSGTLASGVYITQSLVGASGDTTSLTGVTFISAITTQTETESIANISQVEINEPFITDNLTGTIGSAQSLLITGAPTEGTQNWALKILSGDVNFAGDILDIGSGGGDIDILFRGCSTFFMGTLSSPERMIFGVGSTGSLADSTMSIADDRVIFNLRSQTGDFMEVNRVSVNFALSSGSSVTVAAIPAGSFVVGITARVTTAVTGPAGFDIGDGVDVDRWGNSIAVGLGTTVDITDFTATELSLFPTTNDVVITSDGVDFTGGAVRVVVHYLALNAPTS